MQIASCGTSPHLRLLFVIGRLFFIKMKIGEKVKVINLSDCPERVTSKIKEGDILTIRYIKNTGGLLFEGIFFGNNIEGYEQGLTPNRVESLNAL
jgi:hypothetical protein